VAPGGYLWWYVDAVSDDGRHALTIIAFVGSVFSSWYAWAQRRRGAAVDPVDHCAINVALYGAAGRRWTMTERGRRHVRRSATAFQVGPSELHWDGRRLRIELDELGAPIPQRVRGRVTVTPEGPACRWATGLDAIGRHRWGPIAPCARVQVQLDAPAASWQGHAYLDSNEGDEPIERPFRRWDWCRATLEDGSTAVIYDLQPREGEDRVIARCFAPDGTHAELPVPPVHPLPRSAWRIARTMRSDAGVPPRIAQQLEDTPFYQRALVDASIGGRPVRAVHESLDLPRLQSLPVRLMLPFRMPRRT
jgi:carotenoid 1,2-hydratase